MVGGEIAAIEKELEDIYNEIKELAAIGPALERFQRFDGAYQRTRLRERTKLVFCGKSSTGKSTIMRALTGDDSIAVGMGETTNQNQEFLWGDGLLLVDTPGIFTDTAANEQKAQSAMDEADMIAYCVSENLFDHMKKETEYFKQLLRDYRDKLLLCITKCPRTSQDLYFNIQNDICDAIGEDAYYGTGGNILRFLIFDAKDYIEGQKNGDEGLIRTSNFECFLDCINGFSESETYASRCAARLRQMQGCLDEIRETIPCLSQEDRELSKEEAAEINRIDGIRERTYAHIKNKLNACESKVTLDMREALRQNDAAELLPQMEMATYNELSQAVYDVLDKIRPILEELEIIVQIDSPEMAEIKIEGSDIKKCTKRNRQGQYTGRKTAWTVDTTINGVNALAEMAKKDATKRSWWQFWKKTPEIGGKGTELYQRLSRLRIGPKIAPRIGKCVVFLEKHQFAMQASFTAVGVGIELIQDMHGEWNEKKRQEAVERTLQDFNANIRRIVHSIMEDLQKSVDSNCQRARNTIHYRFGHDTPEGRARQVALDLQSRIDRLREEV